MKTLLAPWRHDYVTGAIPRGEGCPFCDLFASPSCEDDTVYLGRFCALVMNAYPYTSGHVMVVPFRHVADLTDLTDQEGLEFFDLQRRALEALRRAFHPQGINVGINLGQAAGAGVAGHLHCHLVPRWSGDVNFMQVFSGTAVVPMTVPQALAALKAQWR